MTLESEARKAAEARYGEPMRPSLELTYPADAIYEHRKAAFVSGASWAVSRITPEQVEELLNSEVHGPMSSHDPRDGSCQSCPWPLHELPPADVAAAIVALYRGVQQPNEDDEGGQEA